MFFLKQSTAYDIKLGPFVDKTDGVTYEVGMAAAMDNATTGVRLSKNGGAFGDRNEATEPVYDAFGYYLVKLSTTDTNTVGMLKVIFGDAAVCLPCEANFQVLEEAIFDSLMAASAVGFDANQRVNVGQWLSQAVTLSTGNKPDVNIDEISDDTTAPGNLELMFDGTGYAGGTAKLAVDVDTIKTQTVTCAAGVTVLASVGTAATSTAQTGDTFAKFSGITSLAQWLGLLSGKQVGDATARTELRATGAGSGTFDETTDSVEAIRDTAPLGTAMRGTDSAALASVCTEGRLAELDAANLPTDIANVKTDTAAVLLDTGTDGVVVAAASKTGYDLVDAPNATAITAIQTSIKGITIADADTLGANTWLLWLRRLKWVLTGKLSVVDATGAFTLTKDDGVTAAGTGSITDDSTTTIRTVVTWA